MERSIQIYTAPSILGLKPGGVELLSQRLMEHNLAGRLSSHIPTIDIPNFNHQYRFTRDKETNCLNPFLLKEFSLILSSKIGKEINNEHFQLVLGGDCSILLGVMHALKKQGKFGLLYLDAHADFYQPSKSTTGEVADMGLAIVTGNGPELLTNIGGLRPYVTAENVIHIGQRDAAETKEYGSQDIRDFPIKCFDCALINKSGVAWVADEIVSTMSEMAVEGYWLHFDTDVISDKENPAVDYRLPGGLSFEHTTELLAKLLATRKVIGMTVTIFNPAMDKDGIIAEKITACITKAFTSN